jgi:hypothetical protein
MLDRLTNLLAAIIALIVTATLGANLVSDWKRTEPWDQEWAPRLNNPAPQTARELTTAMMNASGANDYKAVQVLRSHLETHFEPSGVVTTRFSKSELAETAIFVALSVLLFLLPCSLNYVRRGRFRLWNKQLGSIQPATQDRDA